jgi:uncharacterized protein
MTLTQPDTSTTLTPDRTLSDQAWLDSVVPRLQNALQPEKIILFGSVAQGQPSRTSDIDLLVVWQTSLAPLARIGVVLEHVQDAPRPVDVLVYTPSEFASRQALPFLRHVLKHGKLLYER